MEIVLKTNNDLKYLIKRYGAIGVKEAINNGLIYKFQDNYYYKESKFKVEDNLLIQITKLLFKNQFCKEAIFLLSCKSYFVNQIRDVLKYSYNAYEHYFLGISLKELNPNKYCFTQIIRIPFEIKNKYLLLNKIEQLEIIQLYNKFLDKIIWLLENNYSLSIFFLDEGILNSNNQEIISKLIKIKTLLEKTRRI